MGPIYHHGRMEKLHKYLDLAHDITDMYPTWTVCVCGLNNDCPYSTFCKRSYTEETPLTGEEIFVTIRTLRT